MRLLAVDDDPSILELLTHILESFGYSEVVTAASGPDALDLLSTAQQPFDCLLLDVQMPVMTGIDLCEEVRKLPDYRYTPIIMLTAMVQKQYIDKAFEAGASDYVTKPFDFEDLKTRLSEAYRMADERKMSLSVIDNLIEETGNTPAAPSGRDFGDPAVLDELPKCIGLSEFENYVFKISTTPPLNSAVVAVKVENAREVFDTNSNEVFRQIMATAGAPILKGDQTTCNFASYWGSGVFLVVRDLDENNQSPSLADELTDRSIPCDSSARPGLELSYRVGQEIPLRATSMLEAIFLTQRAVESVEEFESEQEHMVV